MKGELLCHAVEETCPYTISSGADEIGVSKEANLDRLVKVFVQMSEGTATRWIQMPKGIVVLLMVPDSPASGAIYLYDRVGQQFYLVSFDQAADDTLTIPEFEDLLGEYRLLTACPIPVCSGLRYRNPHEPEPDAKPTFCLADLTESPTCRK